MLLAAHRVDKLDIHSSLTVVLSCRTARIPQQDAYAPTLQSRRLHGRVPQPEWRTTSLIGIGSWLESY